MQKQNLTRASQELFRRAPDERYASLDDLWRHCQESKERSTDYWRSPAEIRTVPAGSRLDLMLGSDTEGYRMNDWSFSQLCKLAGVSRDTVNKVSPDTAGRILGETLPEGGKPLQVLTLDRNVRSIHGASYTRLHNLDLLAVVKEFATDFQPPQTGCNGATGLYCGEQDMFVFMIDPTGWAEIEGEAFAPGFFLWNSEVGRRSVGVQTFWFQAVCQNHIVWDAVEVVDFSRKHTANVSDSLSEIRRILAQLVERRDERRDGFARVMKKAFETRLGDTAEDVAKVLFKHGIPRDLAKQALLLAERQGRFTIFSLVDALTKVAGKLQNAGDRIEADEKAGALLALADYEPKSKPRPLLAAAV
jgi:hypothetical protein